MCCTIMTITLGVLIQVSQGVVFYQHTTEYLYHCTPSSTVLLQQVERDGRPLKGLSAMDGEGGGSRGTQTIVIVILRARSFFPLFDKPPSQKRKQKQEPKRRQNLRSTRTPPLKTVFLHESPPSFVPTFTNQYYRPSVSYLDPASTHPPHAKRPNRTSNGITISSFRPNLARNAGFSLSSRSAA